MARAMRLTKTDFLRFLHCEESLWMLKHAPDSVPRGEPGAFERKLARDGYAVERWFQTLLGDRADFQREFETDDGLYARADGLEVRPDGATILYEVKSSTGVRDDQVLDACFQTLCAERAGQPVDRTVLVHLNGDYRRAGSIDPAGLLVLEDVTERVAAVSAEVAAAVDRALALLARPDIDRDGCGCLYRGPRDRCDTFALLNPALPEPSIDILPRLGAEARRALVDRGILGLDRLPPDVGLSARQAQVVRSAREGRPLVDRAAIRQFLDRLDYPLHFFDFETYAAAVPPIDGQGPHRHVPVQYSLHVMSETGDLEHREYLEREARLPDRLVARMAEDFEPAGSVLSWHAGFEIQRNDEMAALFPERAPFLQAVNRRMVDLEDVFKSDYVDARFGGSTSIKKVLPVIRPALDYADLAVGDGTAAMEAWERMLDADPAEADRIAEDLLRYCERDTFAMVEILRFLVEVAR